MNPNDPSSPKSESTADGFARTQPIVFQKVQRYAGVIAVIGLAYFLLSPSNYGGTLDRFTGKSIYLHKTELSTVVASNWRAFFVKEARRYVSDCRGAKYGEYAIGESMQRSINICIFPNDLLISTRAAVDLAEKAEPEYYALISELNKLRNKTLKTQRIDIYVFPPAQPLPTPEIILLNERLGKVLIPLVEEASDWLIWTNTFAHFLVVLLAGIGLWFRRGIGTTLLTPFGWVFSSVKKVHEKI